MTPGQQRIGVVGAGLMGAEIAFVFALVGHDVVLCDKTTDVLSRTMQRLGEIYDKGAARSFYVAERKAAVLGAIRATADFRELADRDVVIEAVFEQQNVKAEVLAALDGICPPNCIFATNTSTIPISVLASFVSPARRPYFIGTHYFSPVSRMKLVEVIPAIETDEATLAATMQLCGSAGKVPIRIKDVTGFAVNRLLHVLMIEAVRLVEEGVATPEDIDMACRLGLGHPMGPFELMDATTSSLCLQAQQIMFDAYGERFRPRPPAEAAGASRLCWRPRPQGMANLIRAQKSKLPAAAGESVINASNRIVWDVVSRLYDSEVWVPWRGRSNLPSRGRVPRTSCLRDASRPLASGTGG